MLDLYSFVSCQHKVAVDSELDRNQGMHSVRINCNAVNKVFFIMGKNLICIYANDLFVFLLFPIAILCNLGLCIYFVLVKYSCKLFK